MLSASESQSTLYWVCDCKRPREREKIFMGSFAKARKMRRSFKYSCGYNMGIYDTSLYTFRHVVTFRIISLLFGVNFVFPQSTYSYPHRIGLLYLRKQYEIENWLGSRNSGEMPVYLVTRANVRYQIYKTDSPAYLSYLQVSPMGTNGTSNCCGAWANILSMKNVGENVKSYFQE